MSPSRLLPLLLPPPATRALRAARRLVDWSRTEPTTPRASFSQCGEDLIIAFYCRSAGLGVPEALLEQLRIGGRLIAPVGGAGRAQHLVLIERTGAHAWKEQHLDGVHFVPLLPGTI